MVLGERYQLFTNHGLMMCSGADDLMPQSHIKIYCKARALAELSPVMLFRVIVNVAASQIVIYCRCLEGAFPLKTCLSQFSGSLFTQRYALNSPVDEYNDRSLPTLLLSFHP